MSEDISFTVIEIRRVAILLCLTMGVAAGRSLDRGTAKPAASKTLAEADNDLLDDLSRRSFRYFWEQTNPTTGLVMDRALTTGDPEKKPAHAGVASIAATGFGLTGFCIAADHHWISREMARQRVLAALDYFARKAPQEHGWFYHYVDALTGERRWHSEVSSIDTALLLAGILTARQYFHDDPEIAQLATTIYERVDFPWMMDGSQSYFSHGWTPEKGFLPFRWDTYSELMILYVLGIGSHTHPISADAWDDWNLPVVKVGSYTYVGGGPLFIHQYSQAFVDLRNRTTPGVPQMDFNELHVNYFANSVAATRAQQEVFAKQLSRAFPGYSNNVWGVTASDSEKGYTNWGTNLEDSRIDGTVVPSAAAGSLMFAPDICIPALRTMLVQYGKKVYGRYGFADAFNPSTGWVSQNVIGIDVGISMISAENLRTGRVWEWFMDNAEAGHALDLAGLVNAHDALQAPKLVAPETPAY